jgi:hypothetical protein
MLTLFKATFDAAWTTTMCAIFGGIIALPYGIYRWVRKDKPKTDLVDSNR